MDLALAGLFGIEMDGQACRVVAELLLDIDCTAEAEEMCRKALESLTDEQALEQFRTRVLMGEILCKKGNAEDAQELVDLFSATIDSEGSGDFPPAVKRKAYIIKARTEAKGGNKEAAANAFKAARAADPSDSTKSDVLREELELYYTNEDYKSFIETLKSWTAIDRLVCMTGNYDEESTDNLYEQLLKVAAATEEVDYITKVYEEAIGYLDNVNAGAPLRLRLADLHMELFEDAKSARKVLDEVFDSTSTGYPYAVTGQFPAYTLEYALEQQSDVLVALFRDSTNPEEKRELLESIKGLMKRPLASAVPPVSDTWILHYHLNVAMMQSKMGPGDEFQKKLQWLIDICIEGLTDKVGWNDQSNVVTLSRALYLLSKAVPDGSELKRVSDILSSARFSHLDAPPEPKGAESTQGTEGDAGAEGVKAGEGDESANATDDDQDESSETPEPLPGFKDQVPPTNEGDVLEPDRLYWRCNGSCDPKTIFYYWHGRIMYECVTCDTTLCEPCYNNARMADNTFEKTLKKRRDCIQNHDYVKSPIEGWKGITKGTVKVGETETTTEELLNYIKGDLCKKGWEDFWRGAN